MEPPNTSHSGKHPPWGQGLKLQTQGAAAASPFDYVKAGAAVSCFENAFLSNPSSLALLLTFCDCT